MKRLTIESPLGRLLLVGTDTALTEVVLHATAPADDEVPSPVLERAAVQLREYFDGARTSFDLPLEPKGTPFQQEVWRALLRIPFAETCTYGDIARELERPGGSRAVGQANGKNPIAVIVPCHRVVATGGGLGGYTGGLQTKRWLLDHEAAVHGFELKG